MDHITSMTPSQLKVPLEKGVEVLDVRKPGEWNAGHLKRAKFLPLSDFPENLGGLDKNKLYIVHCGAGYRSMTAISIMKNLGFTDLINVQGGFGAMEQAGLDVVGKNVSVELS
jgi:hydroxyacylglutathione hydrolase